MLRNLLFRRNEGAEGEATAILSAPGREAVRKDVFDCYNRFLGREPDPAGLESWTATVKAGLSFDDLRSRFIGSGEFHARSPEAKAAALASVWPGDPLRFSMDDIDSVVAALQVEGFRERVTAGAFMLPDDFDTTLSPDSPEYAAQQLALWRIVTGRSAYDPEVDEDTPEVGGLDAIYRPAFYSTEDPLVAGEHLVALGHMVKLSGLKPGGRALEYGAGFGQIALAFARLGFKVDTVDINRHFSGAVNQVAAHFKVDLTAHVDAFGFNPAGAPSSYDLIYFYESFHHCLQFREVLPRLRDMLKEGGRILLGGEPVLPHDHPLLPYPWGLRLDGECVAVMRQRGWMELGFREDYLLGVFAEAGFAVTKHELPGFHYATVYVAEKRPL